MGKQRKSKEQQEKPKNNRELATRLQVLSRYLAMSTWTPRALRRHTG